MESSTIAFFIPYADGGGTERQAITICNGMAEKGVSIDLVMLQAKGALIDLISPKVNVVDLNAGRTLTSLFPLWRYLKKRKPRALMSSLIALNVIAILATLLNGKRNRLYVSLHDTSTIFKQDAANVSDKVAQHLFPLLCRFAHGVLSVSKGVAEDFKSVTNIGNKKVTVIYNPVVNDLLYERSRQSIAHPWFAKNRETPVILAVGRLVWHKDYVTLLHAFAQLRAKRDVKLYILGEGELRSSLQNLIEQLGLSGDVLLAGFAVNPFPYIANCDLYVMSSVSEGLPGGLVEALALAPRIISTDCPNGPKEILKGGQYGCLVPVKSVELLAQAMAASLDKAPQARPPQALDDFREETVIQQYIDHFFDTNEEMCSG